MKKVVEIQFFSGAWNSSNSTYDYYPYCREVGSNYYDAYSIIAWGRTLPLSVRGISNHWRVR